jgi:hypothetical protein
MYTPAIKQVLVDLRHGRFDPNSAPSIESLSATALLDDMRRQYAFVFQERHIGRKTEIGMAHNVSYMLTFQHVPDSLLQGVRLYPALERCFLVSYYGDEITEITWARRILVRSSRTDGSGLFVSFSNGTKLDKTVDGWRTKPLNRKKVFLSEDVLRKRGWQFDILPPFGITSFSRKS